MNILLPLKFGKFIEGKLKCKLHCSKDIIGTELSQFTCSVISMLMWKTPKGAPVSIRDITVETRASCSGILHLHLSSTDSTLHPVAFFQFPEGQRNPNHLLFSSLINSLGMVSNQTHRVIKGSHHTLSFRKFQKFQNFSEFTNSASRYTCSVCFLSKLLGVCDKFIFLCYRALNTQVVTEKSWEDPNGSCQAIIDL